MAKDPCETLDKLAQALDKRVGDILWDTLTQGRDFVRALEPLKKRTKGMPYVRRPIQLQGNLIEAGLYAPPKWAEAHIGVGETTISPKNGHQFLAIPTDFVRQVAGHPVGPKAYNGLQIFGGIIWGLAGWGGARTGGGIRQRRAAGEKMGKQTLIPLFILKKGVVYGKRLNPQTVIDYLKPIFLAGLQKACLIDNL